MSDRDDIPLDTKRAILVQERQMWANTRYQMEIRMRVQRRLGASAEIEAGIVKELERCEQALDVLREELAALPMPLIEGEQTYDPSPLAELRMPRR